MCATAPLLPTQNRLAGTRPSLGRVIAGVCDGIGMFTMVVIDDVLRSDCHVVSDGDLPAFECADTPIPTIHPIHHAYTHREG